MSIEKPVQGFSPFRQFGKVSLLQHFGERIEQAPDRPDLKLFMRRLPPGGKHIGNHSI